MSQLTDQQTTDLIHLQQLLGSESGAIKRNLIMYHGAEWALHITPTWLALTEIVAKEQS